MLGSAPMGFASSGSQQNPYAQGGMGGNKPPQFSALNPTAGQNVSWGGQQQQRSTGPANMWGPNGSAAGYDPTWGNISRPPQSSTAPAGIQQGLGGQQQPPAATPYGGGLGGQGAAMFWGMMGNRGQQPVPVSQGTGYGGWIAPKGTPSTMIGSLGNGGFVPGGRYLSDGSFRAGANMNGTSASGMRPSSGGGTPGVMSPGGGGGGGPLQYDPSTGATTRVGGGSPISQGLGGGVMSPMMSGGAADGSGAGYKGPPTSDTFNGTQDSIGNTIPTDTIMQREAWTRANPGGGQRTPVAVPDQPSYQQPQASTPFMSEGQDQPNKTVDGGVGSGYGTFWGTPQSMTAFGNYGGQRIGRPQAPTVPAQFASAYGAADSVGSGLGPAPTNQQGFGGYTAAQLAQRPDVAQWRGIDPGLMARLSRGL